MENWDEIRTAYHVARLGTVSGAAEALGVHHATVIRHIDALEKRLGAKLFQRHARGYTPTEAGHDLLNIARETEDQFAQLAGRIRGRGEEVSGEIIVTSIASVASLITPAVVAFQEAHPGLIVRFLTDERLFRLEYGEAHVAIRAGAVPDQPDNVVQPFFKLRHALYASYGYAAARGLPASDAELPGHFFVGEDTGDSPAPFLRWMRRVLPADRITWRGTDPSSLHDAIRSGAGLGFVPVYLGARDPALVEAMPSREEWLSQLWLLTHVDLHRTPKVQAFLAHLKSAAKDWAEA